jgi:hypothetical protein
MTLQYTNWVADERADQAWTAEASGSVDRQALARRTQAVQAAIATLSAEDQQIVREFHFEGKTYLQIAELLGRGEQWVRNQHARAIRRLRSRLADFVEEEFALKLPERKCVICSSVHRKAIEALLLKRQSRKSYSDLMREILRLHGVKIRSAMTIVGHSRYHM